MDAGRPLVDDEEMTVLKPYPSYRHLRRLPWLGQIPAHWEVKRLKHVANVAFSSVDKHSNEGEKPVYLCNYVDVYKNEEITSELEFMKATASVDEVGKFTLKKDDVMITKDSESWNDIAIPAYVPEDLENILCGYHLALVRPNQREVDGRFLFRALQARPVNYQFEVEATGITRYGIDQYAIGSTFFPLPPLPEQQTIAAYLDRQTAKIDVLIAKKQRLLDLLAEQRAAIISQAVTKGLNSSAKMKDSGIPWLGQVPSHWEALHLRRVINKFVDYRGHTPQKVDDGIPLITARNIKNGKIDWELSQEYIPEELYDEWMVRGFPEKGDVLVTTEAPLGETAQITETRIALAQRIILLKADKTKIKNDYLKYFLASSAGQGELWSRATGSTAVGIKASHLKEIIMLVPPIDEQREITKVIQKEEKQTFGLIAKVETAIGRLREYRSALISSVVTGKVDVREFKHS